MHKATQNVEIEEVQGGWGSPKFIGHITQPIDRAHTTSYSNLIETMKLSCTIFKILSLIFQKFKSRP